MNRRRRRWFWIETALAMLSAVLFVSTFFVPDWIEAVFRIDPDAQSGSLEAAIVTALAVTTFVSSVLAYREWRRPGAGRLRSEVT
jgi:membrane protein implicated in regulation of membrane protease activity